MTQAQDNLHMCSWGPQRIGWCPTLVVLVVFFLQSTYTNLLWKQTDTPRNNGSPATWASFSPVKLAHKINHHNDAMEMYLRQNLSDGVFKHNLRNIWERTSGGCLELETKTKVEVEKEVLILGGKTVPSCCCSENKDKNKNITICWALTICQVLRLPGMIHNL